MSGALRSRGPRRVLAALAGAALLAAALLAAGTLRGSGAGASSTYRVDVIFDTAKGIIPGQLVKIAGARAGSVSDVVLTPDYKARIEMQVDGRFAPFRSDARCAIKPEGLISENFVQCTPGTPRGHPLSGRGGNAPTVPVTHTTLPVSLTDLFQIWQTPVRERLSVVIATLGIGAGARGPDFNAILRRANPTLAQVRRVLDILDRQREQLAGVVTSADTLAAELARRRGQVGDFVDRAAQVTARTAAHRAALAQAIRRLPPLLDAARPALTRLDELTVAGTPVLADLHAAAPQLHRLTTDLRPFSRAALPAIQGLGRVAVPGIRAARSGAPVVGLVRRLADVAGPFAQSATRMFTSLRDRGAVENLLAFAYYVAAGASREDAVSHILPAHFALNACSNYATTPGAGCDAHFGGAPPMSSTPPAAASASGPAAAHARSAPALLDFLLKR